MFPSAVRRAKPYLDPYTGAFQTHTSFFNTQRFFRSFHRRFFDGSRGITIVTLTGIVLSISGLSGFVFYKGWLKQFFALERSRGPRRLWSDLHKTTGIWALLFSLLIAFTGVFYFVEVCFQSADNYRELLPPRLPGVDRSTLFAYGPQPELKTPNEYAELAQKAFPDLDIRTCRMPVRPGAAVYFDGQAGNPLIRDRANKILLHTFTGEVVATQHGSDLSVVPFITDLVDPVHFGYFGGLGTKILWCVFGLALSFSILAGTYLWVVRTVRREGSGYWLRGSTVSLTLTAAYFIVVVFTTIDGIRNYGGQPLPRVEIFEGTVGPYRVAISRTDRDEDGKVSVVARFIGGGFPNFKETAFLVTGEDRVRARGSVFIQTARLPGTIQDVTLEVTTWDNIKHERVVPIGEIGESSAIPESMPDVRVGVWWVIATFSGLTLSSIVAWFVLIWRVIRPKRILTQTSRDPYEEATQGVARAVLNNDCQGGTLSTLATDPVIDLLLKRRSLVAAKITEPGPTAEELEIILRCATRVPDHGKLTPWRIQVIQGEARADVGRIWGDVFKRKNPDATEEQIQFEYERPTRAPLMLAVSTKIENDRIPVWEQVLSGAAVCQNALIAAHALGYHSQWLSEWPNYDEDVKSRMGLELEDRFLGFIYIGTASEPPVERPRPEFDDVVSYWE